MCNAQEAYPTHASAFGGVLLHSFDLVQEHTRRFGHTHNMACELCCDRIAGCWLQDGGFKFTAGGQRGCEVFCTLDGCVLPGSSYLDGVSMSGVVHCL